MKSNNKQILLLLLRNEIANKEFAIQCAERDNARGEWMCDWGLDINAANIKIAEILRQLELQA